MHMNRVANMISRVLEPMSVAFGLGFLGGWQAQLRGSAFFYYLLYLLGVIFTIGMVRIRLTRHLHTNWDISDRNKRIKPLFWMLLTFLGIIWSLSFWRNAELIQFYLSFFYWLLGFSLLTTIVKLSGHVAIVTWALGWLIRWHGMTGAPFLILIPLLGWSRIVLKRHSFFEVVIGFWYSLAGLLFLK